MLSFEMGKIVYFFYQYGCIYNLFIDKNPIENSQNLKI